MKKLISIVAITCLCFSLMLGCESKKDNSTVKTPKPAVTTPNNNQSNQNNTNQNNSNSNSNANTQNSNNQNNSNSNSNTQNNQSNQNNNSSGNIQQDSDTDNSYNIIHIYNNTGTDIYSLYSVTSNSSSWGSNILDGDILYSGNEFDIKVPANGNTHWDFMVSDYEGTTVTWTDIDFTSISQVELYLDNSTGQIMAQWK